jgi:iron(III) transport system substrate-binding protein
MALALGACAHEDRTQLIVYSPHGRELLYFFEKEFEAKYPAIDVQWVDMGSPEVLDRLRAEKANPQADVWFGAPAESFTHAATEGLLEPYTPSWAKAVSPAAHDSADRWYGTYLTPEVIGYNTEAVSAADAPKDWDDVLDPKWKGKVLIRDPIMSGSMRAIFGAMIARQMKDTANPEPGYEWLRRLDASTKEYTLNPTILYQKLGRQEGLITLFDMPDIATLKQRYHIPVSYVIPKSGTPVLVDGIALVKGTKHPAQAKLYYEFVSSKHAEIEAANRFLRIPARTDIPNDSLPQWIQQARREIKPLPVNERFVARHLDEWMRYWDAHIRNRNRRT